MENKLVVLLEYDKFPFIKVGFVVSSARLPVVNSFPLGRTTEMRLESNRTYLLCFGSDLEVFLKPRFGQNNKHVVHHCESSLPPPRSLGGRGPANERHAAARDFLIFLFINFWCGEARVAFVRCSVLCFVAGLCWTFRFRAAGFAEEPRKNFVLHASQGGAD